VAVDVDFEQLQQMQDKVSSFYASGIRAEDMAVRLKYAGINIDKIQIEKDYEELLNKALATTSEGQNLYITAHLYRNA